MSAGILLIFVPLIIFSVYLMLRNTGPDKPAPTPVKTSVPQKENHTKDLDTLAPPPEPLYQKEKPESKSDNTMKNSPEVTGQPTQPQDTQAQEAQPKQPEQKTEEKPAETTISAVNAIKLFMFDRGLNQSIMTQQGTDISLKADSDKQAATLKANLTNYLIKNKLNVTSTRPLKIKDSNGEYTVTFNVEKPKPAPQPAKHEQPKPKPQPKSQEKPKQTPKQPAPKPTAQKPAPSLPKPPAAAKPQPAVKPTAQTEPKPASFKAKLAIVIDDCGYNTDLARVATSMGYPVTLAVIPYTPYATETARIAKASGNTLFLHFPMQPQSYPSFDPGKGALLVNMPEQIIASVTRADVDSLGVAIDGANNHTGSAFTEDMGKMTQALGYLKNYTSRFLDSRTTGGSQAYAACRKVGMRCGANSLFLDNESPNVTSDGGKESHVHDELMLAGKMALSRGGVIVIGHLRKTTVAAFPAALAELERMGVKIVPVTQLMN